METKDRVGIIFTVYGPQNSSSVTQCKEDTIFLQWWWGGLYLFFSAKVCHERFVSCQNPYWETLIPSEQSDDTRRWGFWEVTEFR
jgi:hypothetical protein